MSGNRFKMSQLKMRGFLSLRRFQRVNYIPTMRFSTNSKFQWQNDDVIISTINGPDEHHDRQAEKSKKEKKEKKEKPEKPEQHETQPEKHYDGVFHTKVPPWYLP